MRMSDMNSRVTFRRSRARPVEFADEVDHNTLCAVARGREIELQLVEQRVGVCWAVPGAWGDICVGLHMHMYPSLFI